MDFPSEVFNQEYVNVWRAVVFLEDWKLGHLVEFEQQPITKWEKGDVWTFTHDDLHCAGNASNYNFNTCQVNTRK